MSLLYKIFKTPRTFKDCVDYLTQKNLTQCDIYAEFLKYDPKIRRYTICTSGVLINGIKVPILNMQVKTENEKIDEDKIQETARTLRDDLANRLKEKGIEARFI